MNIRSAVLYAAIGKASGFRSAVGITTFLVLRFRGTRYERLSIGGAVVAISGEFVMDKLPTTPSRLAPPSLTARAAAGGAAAYAIARTQSEPVAPAIAIGVASAVAASYAGHAYRGWASKRVPALAAALVEDAVALGMGAAVLGQVAE